MPLSPEEKDQALALAKGMLLAQKDSLSMAGNLVNNPHFANVPHPVKLEALKQYAHLENEGPYKTLVNIEPDRREILEAIARSALKEGAISLPVSLVVGSVGAGKVLPEGYHPFDSAANLDRRQVKRYARKLIPTAAALFAANAAVGGFREALRQKSTAEEALATNRYLNQIRKSTSDAELNAMLFGAAPSEVSARALQSKLDKLEKARSFSGDVMGLPVVTEKYFTEPESTFPTARAVELGNLMEEEISKQAGLNNTSTSPTFKAESAKIRNNQIKQYDHHAKKGLADDKDAQYRLGKAMAKKFLRII